MSAGASVPEIYGICVVQNEEDVIGESLSWAGRFCEKIWVWDLGSSDRTWEILSQMASEKYRVDRRPDLSYSAGLRAAVVQSVRAEIPEGSWVYILDADEFLVGDPRLLLASAEAQRAALVRSWFLHFVPAEEDISRLETMGEAAWSQIPLERRLRHYLLDPWPDKRFIRLTADVEWTATGRHNRLRHADGRRLRVARRKALIRHYRYRSPAQVSRRYQTRQERREAGYGGFTYDNTDHFRSYAVPASKCNRWREDQEAPRLVWRDLFAYHLARVARKLGWGGGKGR